MMTTAGAYKNEMMPEWGLGLVVEDQPGNWVLVFEHAGRKKFIKEKAKTLVTVNLPPEALEQLKAKLHGRHAARTGKPKSKKPTKNVATFIIFDDQLKSFERIFPGGFEADSFVNGERGAPGATGKLGYKTAGISLAQAELSPERFESATPAEMFDAAKRVLGSTNMVFPIEGVIPFNSLAEEDRPSAMAGLKLLLHGDGDYAARLEQFAASMHLKDKAGKAKKVTWPLATVFGALYYPTEQICVKPTAYAAEGATLTLPVEKSQPVAAAGYRQFYKIAKATQEKLLAAGQKPRDMVDVYSFIYRTHAEKIPAVTAAVV
jgi:hypothetical protein